MSLSTATSNDPVWRDLLGMALAPALFFRAAVHVVVAAATDRHPAIADGSDVTLASPVAALRGSTDAHVARLGSAALAVMFAWGFAPYVDWSAAPVWWLAANWCVLAADPLTAVGGR